MKKIMELIFVCVICSSFTFLAGCNTVKGVGKDVSAGGRDIQRAAS